MNRSGKKKDDVPERTCIVCASKRPKAELLRLVVDGEGVVRLDRLQRRDGRGAYLCLAPDCLARLRLERLQRAFRRPLSEDSWRPASTLMEALNSGGE